ncbi:MAG TPA: metallophosphoesterase [Clostridiaceae bacterium]
MALFAISDFHLSLSQEKPMGIFGDNWVDHMEKLEKNWIEVISKEDTVLICGDLSWSMNMNEGLKELEWVDNLPGKKILIRGNHDYWWHGINKLNSLFSDMMFIQNNYFTYEDVAICGTRGWLCPGEDGFDSKNEKIYLRELNRLELSLKASEGFNRRIVMLHYPPGNDKNEDSGFIKLIKKYSAEKVVYGHLHGPFNYKILEGLKDGTEYNLTSCDYLDFKPIKLLD